MPGLIRDYHFTSAAFRGDVDTAPRTERLAGPAGYTILWITDPDLLSSIINPQNIHRATGYTDAATVAFFRIN
jgi:hypothetical protein